MKTLTLERRDNQSKPNSERTSTLWQDFVPVKYSQDHDLNDQHNLDLSSTPEQHDRIWQDQQLLVEKNGTLSLNHKAYAQADNNLPGITHLHLNENLFTTTQSAIEPQEAAAFLVSYLKNLQNYPTNGVKHLQKTIAAGLHIPPEKIVISHGSADTLRNLFLYLLKKGDTVLAPAPGWSFYDSIVDLVTAKTKTFPLLNNGKSFVYDKDLIADKIEKNQPKVVLICSPNNPTGNMMPIEDFLWLVAKYPDINFILDEAYYGFSNAYNAAREKALLNSTSRNNVFVVRTFSKFYGLANLRIGFLICNEHDGQKLRKMEPVFGITSLNQDVAAHRFNDAKFRVSLQQEYAKVNAYMYSTLLQIPGLTPYQTHANFILVQYDDRWFNIEKTLLQFGFKIKRETINDAQNYLRITYADIATMKQLMMIIEQLASQKTAVWHIAPKFELKRKETHETNY